MANLVPQTALPGKSRSLHDQIAKGLGYFSLALGFTELLAARGVTRAAGIDGHERLVQAYGLREVATGVAILGSHDPTPWIWGRVAGDVADIGTVLAASPDRSDAQNKLWAVLTLLGATALDVFCAIGLEGEKGTPTTAVADYRDRSGFPKGVQASRGAAKDFAVPRDMRAPEALRPYTAQQTKPEPKTVIL